MLLAERIDFVGGVQFGEEELAVEEVYWVPLVRQRCLLRFPRPLLSLNRQHAHILSHIFQQSAFIMLLEPFTALGKHILILLILVKIFGSLNGMPFLAIRSSTVGD